MHTKYRHVASQYIQLSLKCQQVFLLKAILNASLLPKPLISASTDHISNLITTEHTVKITVCMVIKTEMFDTNIKDQYNCLNITSVLNELRKRRSCIFHPNEPKGFQRACDPKRVTDKLFIQSFKVLAKQLAHKLWFLFF